MIPEPEEVMAERYIDLDHATLDRWVGIYTGLVAEAARCRKRAADRSWRVDETYVKVKGEWVYLYRAIDRFGKRLISCCRSAGTKPRQWSFARALEANGLPRKIVLDKSGANTAGIKAINKMLKNIGCTISIEMVRRNQLNNIMNKTICLSNVGSGQCWISNPSLQLHMS